MIGKRCSHCKEVMPRVSVEKLRKLSAMTLGTRYAHLPFCSRKCLSDFVADNLYDEEVDDCMQRAAGLWANSSDRIGEVPRRGR